MTRNILNAPTFTRLLHGGPAPGLGLPTLDGPGSPEDAGGVPELLAEGVAGVPDQVEGAGHLTVVRYVRDSPSQSLDTSLRREGSKVQFTSGYEFKTCTFTTAHCSIGPGGCRWSRECSWSLAWPPTALHHLHAQNICTSAVSLVCTHQYSFSYEC